ncbi:MAG: RimK/LysX family protein [Candidatus Saccharimonadales bacterium]
MAKTTKPVITIGPKEFLGFPDFGLTKVPAKVDTGADSSAIWASNISEARGKLHFTLFDKMSPFYTGEVIVCDKYSVASIKNSFGQTEFRYRVSLKVTIAERTINVRFTLANRENNRYPILLGRRTLHGKFIVDVSRDYKKSQRLLLISTNKTDTIEKFIEGIKSASSTPLEVTYITYDDVQFFFNNGTTKIVIKETKEDIATYDIVHFKTSKERDVTAAMASYLQKRGVLFFDKRAMKYSANSKIYQYVLLNDNQIPVPNSVFVLPSQYAFMFETLNETLGLPFVFKGIHASRGAFNYLIENKKSYDEAVKEMNENNIIAIAQQFIPNDGDYRVLVLGRSVALIILRSRTDNSTHLNNTSQGGTATLVDVADFPTEIITKSITAATVFQLGIGGVDMLQDKSTGEWYCLEVNGDPQIASGSFVNEKQAAYAAYIEKELGK